MSTGDQAVAASASRWPESSSAKSWPNALAVPPAFSILRTTVSASAASSGVPAWWMASLAPASASASAMARPISRRAPVTSAVRPVSRKRSKMLVVMKVASARHSRCAVRHVVEGERHRDAAVVAHQGDDVGDADMAQRLDRALIQAARHPPPVGQRDRHLVDDLLALVVELGRQAAQDGVHLLGRQADLLADPLVRRGRIGRALVAGDDAHRDLALAFAERVLAGLEMRAER